MKARLAFSLAVLLLAPRLATAQQAETGEVEVYREGQFVVYSDDTDFTAERAKAIVALMKDAYAFVKEQQKWKDEKPLEHDLGLHVLTEARAKDRLTKNADAVSVPASTRGPDKVLVNEKLLAKDGSKLAIAHELTHVQDIRQLAANKKKGKDLPHYFKEGRATLSERAFAAKLNVDTTKLDERWRKSLGDVTLDQAKKTLRDDAKLSEKEMDKTQLRLVHRVGWLFVEWLRARSDGKAIAELPPKLAKVVEAVSTGATLEDAWKTELGESLAATQDAFFAFIDATSGKPAERFKGTSLEKKADGKPDAKKADPDERSKPDAGTDGTPH